MADTAAGQPEAAISPFPGGKMGARHHFALSVYWFATNLHWMALLQIIIPDQVPRITPAAQALWMGIILGVGALVTAVAPPIVGQLSDHCMSRFGKRRPYMVTGVAGNLVGLAMLYAAGNARSIWLFLAGYLVIQLGNNIATASYSGVIPDLVPTNQRGEASGWMAAMSQVGMIIGAFSAGLLVQSGHVGASYLVLAVALVLFVGITVTGMRERPLAVRPPRLEWRTLLTGFWIDPRKYPDFAWVWLTRFLFTLGMWMVQPFLEWYMRDVVRAPHPVEQTGYLMALALFGATITGILGGRVSDHIGRKPVVYAANGLMAVTGLAFLLNHSLTYTLIVAIAYGLGLGAYTSVDWALGCDVLPHKEHAAKDMGVWHISMVLPQSLAPFIGGAILGRHMAERIMEEGRPVEHYAFSGYATLFVLAAIFLVLSALLLRNVKGVK